MTPTATGDLQQSVQPALTPEMAQSIATVIQAMRTNRPADAEAICRKWLSTNPACAQHLRLLSHALMKQNRLDEAEERIRFARSLHSEFPQLEEDLGSVLALKGRYDAAIPHFEKAIRQDPTLPMPYKKLGQALIAVGRGNEADDYFKMFLDRDPHKKAVAEAIMQVQEGHTEEAIRMLRGALKSNPDNVDAMRYLASAYLKEKTHLGDAEALLRRASQIAPDYAEVLMLLGSVLMERNKFSDAADAFDRLIGLQPNNDAACVR
jgi:tetratricopeptide (TPR) repeat protein